MSRLSASEIFLFCTFHPVMGSPQGSRQGIDLSVNAKCEILEDVKIEDTNMLSSVVVPTDGDFPEYCRVLGYVRPAINFEIRLPTSDWNGKFYMTGCGGFCGKLESENPGFINAINFGLKRNYAVSTTDSGHWGENDVDGRWAYNNPIAEINFAYRSVHETARVTKAIIEKYYGQSAKKSYFQGCSNGGRLANMTALRYPEDFDGIISGAPALNDTGLTTLGAWVRQKNTNSVGSAIITAEDVKWISEQVNSVCDETDGLADGLIDDPRNCSFDPALLACGTSNEDACLTQDQINTLQSWYRKPTDSSGNALYAEGVPLGSEPFWVPWIVGDPNPHMGHLQTFSEQFYRYLVFQEDPGEDYSITEFDFDKDPPLLQRVASRYNSDNPEIEDFRARGGKLLMWHGWADPVVPPLTTVNYYENVEQLIGSRKSTQDFLRLFMVPSMDHCGIKDGPGITHQEFDPLTALEKWVEEGIAPESLQTTKTDSTGKVLWTRPVCPYPQRAIYKGSGDIKDASTYECTQP